MKIKLSYVNKTIDVTHRSFAKKVAGAMKDLSSSHVYFILQQAYGEIDWSECEKILNVILNENDTNKTKSSF